MRWFYICALRWLWIGHDNDAQDSEEPRDRL